MKRVPKLPYLVMGTDENAFKFDTLKDARVNAKAWDYEAPFEAPHIVYRPVEPKPRASKRGRGRT